MCSYFTADDTIIFQRGHCTEDDCVCLVDATSFIIPPMLSLSCYQMQALGWVTPESVSSQF
jgi:hypothetical protein